MKNAPLLVFAGALFAGAVSAQIGRVQALEGLRVPIHTAEPEGGVQYGTWAAGDTYKASFHDGMTFVPYLGAEYPQNQPWSWKTKSVKVGAIELLESGAPPVRHQQDYRYEYRFGAVTEAYDVLSEGLEQAFVIWQRPAAGDLVVTGSVTTDLMAENSASAHRRLEFSDANGDAIVGYGEAFAFDAVGNRVLVATAYRDGEIVLTVPGAWLATATLPVTVDPLLTRVAAFGTAAGYAVRKVDIAVADTSLPSSVLMTYVRGTSQFDDDVYAVTCDSDYSNGTVIHTHLSTSFDADDAACAYIGGSNKWVIVYRLYTPSGIRTSRIKASAHMVGGTFASSATVSVGTGINDWRPDVGGSGAGGNSALIVFQREDNSNTAGHHANTASSDVMGVILYIGSGQVGPALGSAFPIAADTNDHERPSVNKTNAGQANSPWMCVWQAGASNLWGVYGRQIDGNGTLSPGSWYSDLSLSATEHEVAPVIDGQGGRYAVSFATVDFAAFSYLTGTSIGDRLYVERFDWPDTASGPTASGDRPPVLLASSPTRVLETSGLAYDSNDRSHFVVGYRQTSPSSAHFAQVGYSGGTTQGPTSLYQVTSHTVTGAACAFDPRTDDTLFAYAVRDPIGQTLYGQTLEYVAPPPTTVGGIGCSSAVISWEGNQQIGSEFERVAIGSASSTAAHFMLVSLATANQAIVDPAVLPGCRLLVDNGAGFLGTMGIQFGSDPSWSFALPEWLPPITLHFQDWILDGVLESTQRLSVRIVK